MDISFKTTRTIIDEDFEEERIDTLSPQADLWVLETETRPIGTETFDSDSQLLKLVAYWENLALAKLEQAEGLGYIFVDTAQKCLIAPETHDIRLGFSLAEAHKSGKPSLTFFQALLDLLSEICSLLENTPQKFSLQTSDWDAMIKNKESVYSNETASKKWLCRVDGMSRLPAIYLRNDTQPYHLWIGFSRLDFGKTQQVRGYLNGVNLAQHSEIIQAHFNQFLAKNLILRP